MGGRKTSISLENAFWDELKHIASSVAWMIRRIEETRDGTNLSSAVRVFVLKKYFRP
jgi:predicted DNA-binding ribbon-helix-helix protein